MTKLSSTDTFSFAFFNFRNSEIRGYTPRELSKDSSTVSVPNPGYFLKI